MNSLLKDDDNVYLKYQEWAAWWSGDPNQLLNYYQAATGNFWSQDIKEDRETMLHIPVAGDIASTSADLLFSETPDIKIAEAHTDEADEQAKKAQERLDTILDEQDAYSKMLEMGETAPIFGGVYSKINWDTDYKDFPILSVAQPDNAVPNFKYGFLQDVKFYKIIDNQKNNVYYRLVEIREKGRIRNELYKGTLSSVGKKIPLTAHPYTKDMDEVIEHGFDSLLAWYTPNKRPNRLWRHKDLGQSDLSGIEGIMDSIDEAFTSWMRDLELGKGRIVIDEKMLDLDEDNKLVFDADKKAFVALNQGIAGDDSMSIKNIQFDIRAEQHYATIMELLKQAYSKAGYSPDTFGLGDATSNATATEIKQKQSKTFNTRDKKAKYFKRTLEDMFYWMLQVDNKYFGGNNGDYKVQVNLQDSVQTDPMEKAESINKLSQAMSMSIKEKVDTLHPNWTEEQKENEVEMIKRENGMMVNEPDDLI
jgi:A118 family predicted phage portal protein